jgi:hypothetical protein
VRRLKDDAPLFSVAVLVTVGNVWCIILLAEPCRTLGRRRPRRRPPSPLPGTFVQCPRLLRPIHAPCSCFARVSVRLGARRRRRRRQCFTAAARCYRFVSGRPGGGASCVFGFFRSLRSTFDSRSLLRIDRSWVYGFARYGQTVGGTRATCIFARCYQKNPMLKCDAILVISTRVYQIFNTHRTPRMSVANFVVSPLPEMIIYCSLS